MAYFDSVCTKVENEVVRICIAEDDPQLTMGFEVEAMIRNGLGPIWME